MIWSVTLAEAAVIGKPEPDRGEIVKAFVIISNDNIASEGWKRAKVDLAGLPEFVGIPGGLAG